MIYILAFQTAKATRGESPRLRSPVEKLDLKNTSRGGVRAVDMDFIVKLFGAIVGTLCAIALFVLNRH